MSITILSTINSYLYCFYVRFVLEYGAIIWNPFTSCGSKQIEMIKCKFLKYAPFILNIDQPS